MLIDRAWIMRHIPHQGSMCLIDEVSDWNASRVRCLSSAHRSPTNPLRAHDQLAAVCGIEFAAQAIAIHGALIVSQSFVQCPAGYLASIRNVALHAARLDDVAEDLLTTAVRVSGDDSTLLYDFSLSAGARLLLSGRATIVIGTALISSRQTLLAT
ncbi:MAG: 3-hydroxylacyl-ACP dehydratase [Steroidobacteraceae bacterium]